MPKWMTAIDAFTPVKALGTGVVLSAVNPKNLDPRGGRRGDHRAGRSARTATTRSLVILFVIVASATIGGAVLVYLFGGEKAQHVLDGWKVWLGENNAAVMTVLLVVMGSSSSARASTSSTEAGVVTLSARVASRSRARPRLHEC